MVVVSDVVSVPVKGSYFINIWIPRNKGNVEHFPIFHNQGFGCHRGWNVFTRVGFDIQQDTRCGSPLLLTNVAVDFRCLGNSRDLKFHLRLLGSQGKGEKRKDKDQGRKQYKPSGPDQLQCKHFNY